MLTKKPKAIDLFSGCGGLTLGLKQAGFDVIGAVEISALAVETYKKNHPEVKVWQKDIRTLSIDEMKRELKLRKGQLDLLAGCPPCQGFSRIGPKKGDDDRNDLILEFLRFIEALLPKSIMIENVPGLIKDWRMDIFKENLKEMGFNCGETPVVLNLANYGVPQRRRRMILLASRKKAIRLAPARIGRKTVREAIAELPLPGESGDPLHRYPERRSSQVMEIIKKVPTDGGSRRKLSAAYQLACHKRCNSGFNDVYGRMKWDDVSPTITGGCTNPSKGRFLHPEQDRAITLREAALLQTFPADYQFSLKGGKTAVSVMVGNALPPEFVRIHAAEVIKHLNGAK